MKIAIPSRENQVDGHFGHCEYFTVFTVNDNNEIVNQETVESAAGCGCRSNIVGTLADMGVNVLLAGNMGDGAVNVIKHHGIEVLRGCAGNVKTVAEDWINGKLQDSGIGCSEHGGDCH